MGPRVTTAPSFVDLRRPLQPPGGMMIWVFIFFDFMEMKHAHRGWQAAMTLFVLLIIGAVSFSL